MKARTWLPVAVSFAALFVLAFAWPSIRRGESDLLSFYTGAKLVGTPHLYSVEHAHQIQGQLGRPSEVRAYIRPPFYAALLWPLGKLPYEKALAVWQLLNLAALGGFVWLWSPRALSVVMCCWFFPAWMNFAVGQDMPLILFCVSLSVWLLRRKRDFLAGLVLALCGAKFQLFLLLPVLIVARRLWRLGLGLTTGAAALLAVSAAVAGWAWPARYYALLEMNERFQASQSYMPNLNGLFHGVPHSAVWIVMSTVAVIAGSWYVFRRSDTEHALAVSLCAGLLIGLHSFIYDCAILLPLFLTRAGRAGFGITPTLSMLIGSSALALTAPSISVIGQLSVLLLFCWIVYRARQTDLAPSLDRLPDHRVEFLLLRYRQVIPDRGGLPQRGIIERNAENVQNAVTPPLKELQQVGVFEAVKTRRVARVILEHDHGAMGFDQADSAPHGVELAAFQIELEEPHRAPGLHEIIERVDPHPALANAHIGPRVDPGLQPAVRRLLGHEKLRGAAPVRQRHFVNAHYAPQLRVPNQDLGAQPPRKPAERLDGEDDARRRHLARHRKRVPPHRGAAVNRGVARRQEPFIDALNDRLEVDPPAAIRGADALVIGAQLGCRADPRHRGSLYST